jgi:glycosyltransferase involved in cell wall biosynthesis
MKIVYLARRPIPSVNAHSVQIVKMSEAFGKLGHDVLLLAHRGDEEPQRVYSRYGVEPAFAIDSYPKNRSRRLRKVRFCASLIRDSRMRSADLFFGRDIFSLALSALFNKPIVFEAHTLPPGRSVRRRLLKRLFASKNFSHLVCVTSTLAQAYRRDFASLEGKPVIVVPNAGAECANVKDLDHWPGRPGAVQVGFIGRPFVGKGIEVIAEAAARLPEYDFHIVGASASDVDWIEGEFPPNLHFHGYQPHALLGAYQRRFDIAVAPYGERVMNASDAESAAITSPLKVLEYMAAGLPVIVSDLPGVRDILSDESVVVLVPPGDIDRFVCEVRRLAEDRPLRERIGAAARRHYLERHTLEARARRVLEPALARCA